MRSMRARTSLSMTFVPLGPDSRASFPRNRLAAFKELGGVGPEEEIRDPIEEHQYAIEVVAQLVEVDAPPDERPEQPAQLDAQDTDHRAALPEVQEMAERAVVEGLRFPALDLRGEVESGP